MDAPLLASVAIDQAALPNASWLRYLKASSVSTVLLLLLVSGLNIAVDPFFVFTVPLIRGFNYYKPATQGRETLAKSALLPLLQPRTVLIGTSKVQVGLDPDSPVWRDDDKPVFNAGLPGNTSSAMLAVLEEALATAPVRRVLVLLEPIDLMEPSPPLDSTEPFHHTGRARLRGLIDAILTRDALEASFRTLAGQWTDMPSGLRPNGQMYDGNFRGPTAVEGPGALFAQKMQQNAQRVAGMARRLADRPDAEVVQLEAVRRIIYLCFEKNVTLDLAVAPVHADMLRLVDLAGLWPRYIQMREDLARMVEQTGGSRVRLWNFTGFDAYSSEPVPSLDHPASAPRWFWEPNHFRREYGELLLQTIYRARDDVGTQLGASNLNDLDEAQAKTMNKDRAEQPGEWVRAASALAAARAQQH